MHHLCVFYILETGLMEIFVHYCILHCTTLGWIMHIALWYQGFSCLDIMFMSPLLCSLSGKIYNMQTMKSLITSTFLV